MSLIVAFARQGGAAEPRDPLGSFLYPASNSVDYFLHESPGPSDDPNILENRARGTFIVSKSTANTVALRQTVGEFQMSRALVIAQTGLVLPQSLWDVDTGASYKHHIGDRRDLGISGSVGSASDEPFHSIHETTFRATGTYQIPASRQNSWLFLLSYSNNRHFANNIPLPGVAYLIHSPEHGLEAALGLPFLAVTYKPDPRWTGRLAIFGPKNVSAEWAFAIREHVHTYAGFDWGQQEWLRANRADNSNRLIFDEKKWGAGFRFPVVGPLRMDVGGGYEFNRRFYENDRAVSRDFPEAGLHPAWTFQAKLATRW